MQHLHFVKRLCACKKGAVDNKIWTLLSTCSTCSALEEYTCIGIYMFEGEPVLGQLRKIGFTLKLKTQSDTGVKHLCEA